MEDLLSFLLVYGTYRVRCYGDGVAAAKQALGRVADTIFRSDAEDDELWI